MDRAMLHTVIAFVVTLGIAWQALVFIPDINWQILTINITSPLCLSSRLMHGLFFSGT
jgi:hypothetical protein